MTDKIILLGSWRSAASYRVRIALALKGLTFEETSLDLLAGEQFSDVFSVQNPQNAVPVLIDGEVTLTQSLAIIEYLENKYPTPHLFPDDPYTRAIALSFALISIADAHPFQVTRVRKQLARQFGASDSDFNSWAQHWQKQALRVMETRLAISLMNGTFCFGEQPGIADIALAAHVSGAMTFDTKIDEYPNVERIFARCLELDAFSAHSPQALKPAQ